MSIRIKKVTLSSAQMLTLNATPVKVLNAPAAGYANAIIGITHSLTFNTVAYATAATMRYYTLGTNYIFQDTTIFLGASTQEGPLIGVTTNQSIMATTSDMYVTANVNPTAGNSPLIAYIIYETKATEI